MVLAGLELSISCVCLPVLEFSRLALLSVYKVYLSCENKGYQWWSSYATWKHYENHFVVTPPSFRFFHFPQHGVSALTGSFGAPHCYT